MFMQFRIIAGGAREVAVPSAERAPETSLVDSTIDKENQAGTECSESVDAHFGSGRTEAESVCSEPLTTGASDQPLTCPESQTTETSNQTSAVTQALRLEAPVQMTGYSLEGCSTDATMARFLEHERKSFPGSKSGSTTVEELPLAENVVETAVTVTETTETTKVATIAEREVIILPFEKRIVYQRKEAEPKVMGGDVGGAAEKRTRKIRWEKKEMSMNGNVPPVVPGPNTKEKNMSVLERLRSLRLEKPMINPFSLGNNKYDSFLLQPSKSKENLLT